MVYNNVILNISIVMIFIHIDDCDHSKQHYNEEVYTTVRNAHVDKNKIALC